MPAAVPGLELDDGDYGRRAVATAPWSPAATALMKREAIPELFLSAGGGWHEDDISFLSELSHLKALNLRRLNLPSDEAVHSLHELRELRLSTYCKNELRFAEFPKLEKCGLEWRPKAKSLFECLTLKELSVNRYKGTDAAPFGRLVKLETLQILNAPLHDLKGLAPLKRLKYLRLAGLRVLPSLTGVEALQSLEQIEFRTCRRIRSLEPLSKLPRLKQLVFNNGGKIDSLEPLRRLTRLEWVLFSESTDIVDGDLSPLMSLKRLTRLVFRDRRHYSHRLRDFPAGADPR